MEPCTTEFAGRQGPGWSRATHSRPASPVTSPASTRCAARIPTSASTCSALRPPRIHRVRSGAGRRCLRRPDTVEVLIGQMVNLVRDGQPGADERGSVRSSPPTISSRPSGRRRPRRADPPSVDTPSTSTCSCGRRRRAKTVHVQYAHAWLCALARAMPPIWVCRPTPGTSTCRPMTKRGTLIRSPGRVPPCWRWPPRFASRTGRAATFDDPARDYHRFWPTPAGWLPQGDEGGGRPATALGWPRARPPVRVIANGLRDPWR